MRRLACLRILARERDRANLDPSYARFAVEVYHQRLAQEIGPRDVGKEAGRVYVDSVATRRLDDRDTGRQEAFAQVGRLSQAVGQILPIQPLP